MTSNRTLKIGDREVGDGRPCYLIAEVGTTCLGDLDRALALVAAGAEAGVDAVKFQVIEPAQISDPSVTYTFRSGGKVHTANMKEMFERLVFSEEQWRTIARACADAGVHFFATVDYVAGVDMLERVGVPVHKLGAWDTTYRPLIERVGATGKPCLVDLGPTSEDEIDDLVAWFRQAGGSSVLFLHDYHTDDDRQMNLRAVPHLRQRFPAWPVGYSSPARDDDIDIAALALGAAAIEKRLILDRNTPAFHADESLHPDELKRWVERIRHVERALGTVAIRPSEKDLADARKYYRSVCTLRPIRAGEAFEPGNLDGKRPGTGLPTARLPQIWGRRAARDLPADRLIEESDIA